MSDTSHSPANSFHLSNYSLSELSDLPDHHSASGIPQTPEKLDENETENDNKRKWTSIEDLALKFAVSDYKEGEKKEWKKIAEKAREYGVFRSESTCEDRWYVLERDKEKEKDRKSVV